MADGGRDAATPLVGQLPFIVQELWDFSGRHRDISPGGAFRTIPLE